MAEFSGKEIIGKPFELTTDKQYYLQTAGIKINYSAERGNTEEYFIQPYGLLTEEGIKPQPTQCFDWKGMPAFFKTGGDLPFDILSACFYLLSRYEEYLPHEKDMYGRYAYENSLAHKEKFLDKPLINQWLQEFTFLLKAKFPGLTTPPDNFSFVPSYDIDIAWSYKGKNAWRNAGGLIRSFFKADWQTLKQRIRVLRGKEKDPCDAYAWMNGLHERYQLKPYYFFLLADKRGRYDKNIHPQHRSMQALLRDHLIRYPLGIHPSWQTGDSDQLLVKEIATLAAITGNAVQSSRQHYIRFNLPQTFQKLIEKGIRFDFSMGYGSINGFRASVTTPFYWYDLASEQQTALLLFPFCYMDANSFYEQHYTSKQALEEMRHYYKVVKAVNGTLIMIWHNSFLGTDKLFAGWKEVYEEFIKEIKS